MSTPSHATVRAALAAALLTTLPAAHSQMYRWIAPDGSVTYSNQLPSNTSVLRDLTVVLDNADGSRPAEKRSAETPRAPAAAPSANDDTRRPTVGEVLDQHDRGSANVEPPRASSRTTIGPGLTEATRDPCLRSSDPKCIQRNKTAYVPGRGYSPGSAPVGATSSAGGGGSVGGGGPAKLAPPPASAYALPPGSDLPPIPKH